MTRIFLIGYMGAGKTTLGNLIHMATQQEAANLKVVCENSRQSGGKYKTDVVVELPKAGVLSTIINQIKSDDKLKGLFEESQFKQAF